MAGARAGRMDFCFAGQAIAPHLSSTGGELVSTGVVKQLGACRGVNPRKSLAIANITANDENYALAA